MDITTASRAAALAESRLVSGPENTSFQSVSNNSKEAGEGSLFVGLIGNTDGNRYAEDAYANGCRVFLLSSRNVIDALSKHEDAAVIETDDTLKAMQTMAKNYLAQFDIIKIAVTGSVGKTTTKDMMTGIYSSKYKTVSNRKNYNNEIGVPLTVFEVDSTTEAAIFEMGMNHAGEIHVLADIVRPQIACITTVGTSHIGNLGSRENIMKAKMEVTDFMDENCVLVYNADNDLLSSLVDLETPYRKVGVGTDVDENGILLASVNSMGEEGIMFVSRAGDSVMQFYMPVAGLHNAYNALIASACALQNDISFMECSEALMNVNLTGHRLEIRRSGGIIVIDDTYNASPDSVRAAIDTMEDLQCERKVVILGDMLELGEQSTEFHYETGRYAAQSGVGLILTLGEAAVHIAEGARSVSEEVELHSFLDRNELIESLRQYLKPQDAVLVKGSNSMKMNEIAELLLTKGVSNDQ